MTIKYEVKKADLFRAYLRTILGKRFVVGVPIVFIVALIVFATSSQEIARHGIETMLVAAAFVSIVYATTYTLLSLLLSLMIVATRKHTGILGEHTLAITDQGLVERTAFNESLHRWEGVHKVVSTRTCLKIYLNDTMFYYVPKTRPLIVGCLDQFEVALNESVTRAAPPAGAR